MKKLFKNIMALLALSLLLYSCQKDFDVSGTATEAMSGDWWVEMSVQDKTNGEVLANYGYYELSTFNTAANTQDSMWLTDNNSFWQYKVKVAINPDNMTFAVDQGKDLIWDDTTTITNGKIIPNAATTPSGVNVDSIYFEVEWATDPESVYIGSGYRYTGWEEDNH